MKKTFISLVFLLASIILFSATATTSIYIYTLAQETTGNTTTGTTNDSATGATNTTTPQTVGNETMLQTQQNHTQMCAPDFEGTMENIPWSDVGMGLTEQNQTQYPALIVDIMSLADDNHCYRDELKTTDHTQIVLMSLRPGEEIGMEVHSTIDQLLFFVQGSGMGNVSGQTFPVEEGDLVYIPAGTAHNFINTGDSDLKLYTTYSTWNHLPGTLQETKADEAGYVPYGAEVER
jgi:mannose-6-phosphate isomerase-like protein (cupin superfamily)